MNVNGTIERMRVVKYQLWRMVNLYQTKPVSFSQHGEDSLVKAVLGRVDSFIDIGANDGVKFSNTFMFARRGARGLCFEPSRETFWKLRMFHCFHSRVKCINEGISDKTERVTIVADGYEGLTSRLSTAADGGVRGAAVTVRPLAYWVEKYRNFRSVDLVSIDVEGHELEVLKGIDFGNFRTRCMIIETAELMGAKGYFPGLTNGLNTFFLPRGEMPEGQLARIAAEHPGYSVP